jgi:hypothetical protein
MNPSDSMARAASMRGVEAAHRQSVGGKLHKEATGGAQDVVGFPIVE